MATAEVVSTGRLTRNDVEALARFAKRLPHHQSDYDPTHILIDKMQTTEPVPPSLTVYDKNGTRLTKYEAEEVTYPRIVEFAADPRELQLQFAYSCDGLGLIYTCTPVQSKGAGITVVTRDISVYPTSGHAWRQEFMAELTFNITDLAVPGDIVLYLERYITD